MSSRVSIVKCASYDAELVTAAVRKSIDLIGGISNFIKPASRVLVKPNLLMAKPADFGITTHPMVVRAVVRLLKEIDCRIILGDGPSVWGNQIENIEEVYVSTGIAQVAKDEQIELVNFDKRRMRDKFPLTIQLDNCDYLVNIPKFKTHGLTLLTGAIKNLFGLVSGTFKTELHKKYFSQEDFARILVDVFEQSKPALTIIDGIVAMEGDGPGSSGKLRQANVLVASQDCVAVDTVLAKIMSIDPLSVLTTKEAASRKLGIADIKAISVLGEKLEDATGKPFLLPTASLTSYIPAPIANFIKSFIKYRPYVLQRNCIKCFACVKACPEKIIHKRKEKLHFDYAKCIACFCCQEVCPERAIQVKKSLLAKLMRL